MPDNNFSNNKINIFFAYAREDKHLRDRIDRHLTTLKRTNYINTWYDGEINAGAEWEIEISKALSKADIVLLLISVDFIASDYCYEVEMKRALDRHDKGEATIIPIILSHCDWEETPFSKLQALPENGVPITDKGWDDKEVALRSVALGVKDRVLSLLNDRKLKLLSISEEILEKEFLLLEKDDELKIIADKIDDLKLEIENLIERIEAYANKKIGIETEIENLEIRKDEMIKIISSHQVEINRSKSLIEKYKKEIEILEGEIKKYQTKLENVKTDLENMKNTAYKPKPKQ